MMELKISLVRDAISRAFDEGLFGYSDIKDELVDSILSELISASEKSSEVGVSNYSPYSTYCGIAGPISYSFSTSTVPAVGTFNYEEPL